MLKRYISNQRTAWISKNIIIGAGAGGALVGMICIVSILGTNISRFTYPYGINLSSLVIIGVIIGILCGGIISFLLNSRIIKGNLLTNVIVNDNPRIRIVEEQLDVIKNWIQTGDVSISKETLTKEQQIIVPITYEELVVEKKSSDTGDLNNGNVQTQIIRIPISQESIEIIKHPIRINEVTIYKHRFKEINHFHKILKKEKVNIKKMIE